MITHKIDLDMTPGGDSPRICLNKNDADFTLQFSLYSSIGNLNIESGTSAKIQGTKPGGGKYNGSASLSASSKLVTVYGNKNMTDEVGTGVFEICLTHDGKELYSENFLVSVEQITMQ